MADDAPKTDTQADKPEIDREDALYKQILVSVASGMLHNKDSGVLSAVAVVKSADSVVIELKKVKEAEEKEKADKDKADKDAKDKEDKDKADKAGNKDPKPTDKVEPKPFVMDAPAKK